MAPNNDTPNNEHDFLETLAGISDGKDLDELHATILSLVTLYGLKTNEVAMLLTSLMRNVLNQEHNSQHLKSAGINAAELTVNQVLAIQNTLVSTADNG